MSQKCSCAERCYVPVDNQRAIAVFTNALEAVDALMPQAEALAKAKDQEFADAAAERYEVQRKHYDDSMAEWMRQLAEWEGRWFFRGEAPMRPWVMRPWPELCLSYRAAHLSDFRSRLNRLRNVALAAAGPYTMTEGDAAWLIDWESGGALRVFKARFLGPEAA